MRFFTLIKHKAAEDQETATIAGLEHRYKPNKIWRHTLRLKTLFLNRESTRTKPARFTACKGLLGYRERVQGAWKTHAKAVAECDTTKY